MPRKYQIAVAALGSVVAYRLVSYPLRRKYGEVARSLIHYGQLSEVQDRQITYLMELIADNEIELDEFDLIVLNSVT